MNISGEGYKEKLKLKQQQNEGERDFKFKSFIYGHKSVKTSLKKLQHDKCCFCESKITHISHGDVEHYRPKGGYQQNEHNKLKKPGYYWLAYDFSNLFLACQKCNQSYKKNYFPLIDESKRAHSHQDNINNEYPLIIHPEYDDPENELEFIKEIIRPKNNSLKGYETIKRTGIDRQELEKVRWEYFRVIEGLAVVAKDSNNPQSQMAQSLIRECSLNDKQFSFMIKSNFSDLIT